MNQISPKKRAKHMNKGTAEKLVSIPAGEYKLLKEIYRTVKDRIFC